MSKRLPFGRLAATQLYRKKAKNPVRIEHFLKKRKESILFAGMKKDARIPGTESAGEQAFLYRVVLPAVLGNLLCGANQTDRGQFACPVGHVFVDIQRIPATVDIQLVAPYEAGFIQCVQKCRRICPVG